MSQLRFMSACKCLCASGNSQGRHVVDDDHYRSLFRIVYYLYIRKNGINSAVRTDRRKDLTVVQSGWFPDLSEKGLLSSGRLPPFVVSP